MFSGTRLTVLLVFAMAMIAAPAYAKGGYGVVTLHRVGPLTMNRSTVSDVRAFAGAPDAVTHENIKGYYDFKTYRYRFPRNGYVAYTFTSLSTGWVLEAFQTTLERFKTIYGTRVGMSLVQAERREHLRYHAGCYSGLGRQDGRFDLTIETHASRVTDLLASGPYPPPC